MNEKINPRNIAGVRKETLPIMNGAGPMAKLTEHVFEIARSEADIIVLGSITLEERKGNHQAVYWAAEDYRFSLNSMGLPNPGLEYYQRCLPDMIRIAQDHGKPLVVSIAGFSPEEYSRLAGSVLELDVQGIEINLGCPNVWKDGIQKRIASYDENIVGETLRKVEEAVGAGEWISVKLSPYSDPFLLESITSVLKNSKIIKSVTTTNTFPNALAFDEKGRTAITTSNGLSGMGGDALKPISLGQVKQLRNLLPDSIAIIGVGGISKSQDLEDYLKAGADAVQVVTAYLNFGPQIFSRILNPEE